MSGEVFHAPILNTLPEFELSSILERTKSNSEDHYPEAEIVRTFEALLSDQELELIIVNTPNPLHYEMAKAGLAAGKHVVVEKPFTVTAKEGKELIDLASKKGLVISVFHNKRFEGDFHTINGLIKTGRIGNVKTFKSRFDRFKPVVGPKKWKESPQPGAGILYDLGSHLIDQALYLFGEPESIDADLRVEREDGKVVDAFDLVFHYPTLTAILSAQMMDASMGPKFELMGEKGEYVKYGTDPQEGMLKNGGRPGMENWAKDPKENWGTFTPVDGEPEQIPTIRGDYEAFYQNIFSAIRKGEELTVTPEEALRVVEIIEKIEKENTLSAG
jgi:scyllo-inositol 2-dehydrogenase (NADP+)